MSIWSFGGNDTISGLGGDDFIIGSDGQLVAGGNDVISGGEGNDIVIAYLGDDVVNGDAGSDDLNGNQGNDTVDGGSGDDIWLRGGRDNDRVFGGNGNDIHVNGNKGDDIVRGGIGNDTVYGGQGQDQVFGDEGDDFLFGNKGIDTLTGGSGADRFAIERGAGTDTIADFNQAQGDRFEYIGLSEGEITFTFDGSNTILTDTATNETLAIVLGVNVSPQPANIPDLGAGGGVGEKQYQVGFENRNPGGDALSNTTIVPPGDWTQTPTFPIEGGWSATQTFSIGIGNATVPFQINVPAGGEGDVIDLSFPDSATAGEFTQAVYYAPVTASSVNVTFDTNGGGFSTAVVVLHPASIQITAIAPVSAGEVNIVDGALLVDILPDNNTDNETVTVTIAGILPDGLGLSQNQYQFNETDGQVRLQLVPAALGQEILQATLTIQDTDA